MICLYSQCEYIIIYSQCEYRHKMVIYKNKQKIILFTAVFMAFCINLRQTRVKLV